MEINRISYLQAGSEISRHQIERLRQHLYPDEAPFSEHNWRCRYAPSIIIRSEAEVFGLAMPRFAHRITLSADPEDFSFVNARRLEALRSAPQLRAWGRRISPGGHRRVLADSAVSENTEVADDPTKSPATFIQHASPIADSFLKLPKRLEREGFRALEVDLGTAYGELRTFGASFTATPYMKHIRLAGGGMCAQACCFMANCLLSGASDHISGLAEITALAHERFEAFRASDDKDVFELRLSGLSTRDILRYFPKVGLNAVFQRTPDRDDGSGLRTPAQGMPLPLREVPPSREWGEVLRACLRSGIPVLLPVDAQRMAGIRSGKLGEAEARFDAELPIYGFDKTGEQQPFNHHAVPQKTGEVRKSHLIMLSGYNEASADDFLIHDPAVFPFVRASAAQLEAVANYSDDTLSSINAREFITVSPASVTIQLADWHAKNAWHHGLISRIHELQGISPDGLPRVPRHKRTEDLRLMTVGQLREIASPNSPGDHPLLEHRDGFAVRLRGCIDGLADRHGWNDHHYLWAQNVRDRRHSLWLYDAEQFFPNHEVQKRRIAAREPAQTADERRGFLRAVLWREEAGQTLWTERADFPTPLAPSGLPPRSSTNAPDTSRAHAPSPPLVPPTSNKLHPPEFALISSFTINGCQEALAAWPATVSLAELYAFMNFDPLLRAVPEFESNNTKPLYEVLSNMREESIAELGRNIAHAFTAKNKRLVAMASFVPEITDGYDTHAHNAMRGIANLIKLAHAVNDAGDGTHHVKILELVAGSLVDGLWPGIVLNSPDMDVYVANISSRASVIDRLVRGLQDADVQSLVNDPRTPGGLRLAFEFEPGTMGVLGDESALRQFADKLKKANLSGFAGFNLDIPHWDFLGRITPEQLLSPEWESVRKLIFHAHLSDHTKGHFGDSPAMWLNRSPHFFEPWFRALSLCPNFDGVISIEMEAVKSSHILDAAVSGADSIRKSAFPSNPGVKTVPISLSP